MFLVPSVVASNSFPAAWKVLVSEHQGADIEDRKGSRSAGRIANFPFWNAVFLTEQLTDKGILKSRVEEASTCVRGKRNMGLIYICEDYLSGSAKESLSTVRCLNQSAGRQDGLVLHILRPGSPQIVLD